MVLVTGKQEAGINLGEILERSILFTYINGTNEDDHENVENDEKIIIMTMMTIMTMIIL